MSGDRTKYWPLIEKRYGEKMSYWFAQMEKVKGKKYPEQIAFLKENFGFNQAHANALVMYTRGSTTSQRHTTMESFLKTATPEQAKTIKAIFKAIRAKHPRLKLEMAWNKPMLKSGTDYVFGVDFAKKHILIAPFRAKVIKGMKKELADYKVNLKTVQVPSDWKVDSKLLNTMVKACLADIAAEKKK